MPSTPILTFAGDAAPVPEAGRKANEWVDDCGVVFARAFCSEDLLWIDWMGVGVFGFTSSSHEVLVWPQPEARKEVIVETFRRSLRPLILQALGWQALHAGAALGPAGVVALCGSKGAGKSTLALAMRQCGWQQFADDALVLRVDDGRIVACALPFNPRLRTASRRYFRDVQLPPAVQAQPAEVPLVGVFMLQQDMGLPGARVSLIPKARAFSELLEHAHCFDARDPILMRRHVDDYLRVAARVPTFTLQYKPNFQHLPQLTRAVVEAVTGIDRSVDDTSEWQTKP